MDSSQQLLSFFLIKVLFGRWQGSEPTFKITRKSLKQAQMPTINARQTSAHLARLWAKDEVDQLRRHRGDTHLNRAIAMATGYQLVTSVSGAVVLENMEQYKNAGLEPVDPATVPTIPEPETWALIIIAVLVLCWVLFRPRLSVRCA